MSGTNGHSKPAASSTNNSKKVPGKPFVKGQSGNPRGRPKLEDDMKAIVRDFMAERDPSARAIRLRATLLRLYKERPLDLIYLGWGKPTETHNVNVTQEVAGVPPEMLEVLRERFMATVANRN